MLVPIHPRRTVLLRGSFRSFILALLSAFAVSAGAKIDLPAPMHDIESQIKYLIYLQNQIPSLFEQGAEYDLDLFSLIQAQNILVEELKKDPAWVKLADARPPLKDIIVSMDRETKTSTVVLDENALKGALQGIQPPASVAEWNTLIDISNSGQMRSVISGLLSLYPAAHRTRAFSFSQVSHKLHFLRQYPLPNDEFLKHFKPERVGLKERPMNFGDLLTRLETWHQSEMRIAAGLTLGGGKLPFEASEIERKKLAEIQVSLLGQFGKKISKRGQTDRQTVLKMKEVPPFVGVFRGLVGGDCSTSRSFLFPYMPGERTYFLYSGEGDLIGYLMGTLVLSSQTRETYFYIHSISGPRVSKRDVQAALIGLGKAAPELGFKAPMMPTPQNIHRNINYVAIHSFFEEFRGTEHHRIIYLDGPLRDRISENVNTGLEVSVLYDGPTANPSAFTVNLQPEASKGYNITVEPSTFGPIEFNRTLSKPLAVLSAMDLLAGENSDSARQDLRETVNDIGANNLYTGQIDYEIRRRAARQILSYYFLSLDGSGQFELHDHLANFESVSVREYYNRLEQRFAHYDIELNESLIAGRPYLFIEGHLRAKDATSTTDKEMIKRTIDFTIFMLRRWQNSYMAFTTIESNPRFFQSSTKFVNFVRGLFEGGPREYMTLLRLHGAGFDLKKVDVQDLKGSIIQRAQEDPNASQIASLLLTGESCEELLR